MPQDMPQFPLSERHWIWRMRLSPSSSQSAKGQKQKIKKSAFSFNYPELLWTSSKLEQFWFNHIFRNDVGNSSLERIEISSFIPFSFNSLPPSLHLSIYVRKDRISTYYVQQREWKKTILSTSALPKVLIYAILVIWKRCRFFCIGTTFF